METILLNLIFLVALGVLVNYGYSILVSQSNLLKAEGFNDYYSILLQSPLLLKLNPFFGLKRRMLELTKERDKLSHVIQQVLSRQNKSQEQIKTAYMAKINEGMAHELNNSLNIVNGAIKPICQDFEALKSHIKVEGETGAQLMAEVELLLKALAQSAERACDSASNFLDMLPDQIESFDEEQQLDVVVKRMINWYKILYPEITFNFQIEMDLQLNSEASDLLMAINCLLINAIEASVQRPNAKIDIGILGNKGQLVVVVMDNGKGIPNEIKGRIFEPFFTTKDSIQIAGLGLFNIYELITKKDGSIRVKDNPNGEGGTIFSVNLPVD
ncbi:MAG: HAMP domain-containing sensor histidine kinase [Cytophagales bacterium]|nr:HAMP domain-containing sensor histidine kinase [Cytophagales bacterium]